MDNENSKSRKLLLTAAGLTLAVPLGALAWNATAGATSLEEDDPVTIETTTCDAPTAEELAEWEAETDDLAAFLDERGLAYTIETDEAGGRYVDYDYEDEAVSDAVDEFYAARYPMTEEEVAELNAEEDALAAFLDDRGIAYSVDTDASGVRLVEYDWEDEAVAAAVDEYYAAAYPITEDELAEINGDTDALVAAFDEAGIEYTESTDAWGARFVEWDYEDESANAVADQVYAELYPDDEMACAVPVG